MLFVKREMLGNKKDHTVKRILGISLLACTMAAGTAHADTTKEVQTNVKRKVVRVVVKDKPVKADFEKDNRHLIRVYGSQNATGKVIKPKSSTGQMPNLFNR